MPGPDLVVLATSNRHKVREVREILATAGVTVVGLDELGVQVAEPEENGATFADNAAIKALAYARALGRVCLAEDSGLEVDALDGRPGVHSARFAGLDGSRDERDRANNERLLGLLAGVPEERRTARFVCEMCLADPAGNVLGRTRGTYEGVIARSPRGTNGFGYDPLLWLPDVGRTSAELSPEEKNSRSHRGAAARAMLALMGDGRAQPSSAR